MTKAADHNAQDTSQPTAAPPPPKRPETPMGSFSRKGEEVRALLDMLSLSKYASPFHDTDRLNTITDLIDHPNIWKQIIKGNRERETLEGYLSLRQTKPLEEVEASEMRLRTFQVVRTTLRQLRDLQMRKAEMERSFIIHKGAAKKAAKTSAENEASKKKLDDLLDEIDDCKERLEGAQKEMAENPSSKHQQNRKVFKPSTLKPKRPMSAPTAAGKEDAKTAAHTPWSPRVAGEPEIPEVLDPRKFSKSAAPGPQQGGFTAAPSPGSSPRKCFQQTAKSSTQANLFSDGSSAPAWAHTGAKVKGMPPQSAGPQRPGSGKFVFEPDFENEEGTEAFNEKYDDGAPPASRAPKSQEAHTYDIGLGWNRKIPVTKTDFFYQRRLSATAQRKKRADELDQEVRHQQKMHQQEEAHRPPPRKAKVFVSSSGSNGVHVNSTLQKGGGSNARPSSASNRRPPPGPGHLGDIGRSVGQGSMEQKPSVVGVTAKKAPLKMGTGSGGAAVLNIRGSKATKFSLGLSGTGVCIDHNHYAQMKCGAVRRGSSNTPGPR